MKKHKLLLFSVILVTLLSGFVSILTSLTSFPRSINTIDTKKQNNTSITNAMLLNLPMSFEANQGQANNSIQYLSHGKNYSLFLTPIEATFAFLNPQTKGNNKNYSNQKESIGTALSMKLIGANSDAQATPLDKLPGKTNYFIGTNSSTWQRGIPTYAKVKYNQIYPGIDLVYYGNQQKLEYDFIVSPNSNPKNIHLSFNGMKKMSVDPKGNLLLSANNGQITQYKPVAYQNIQGKRKEIAVAYILTGKNQVSMQVGTYDPSQQLVIDPTLLYSTYFGGSGDNSFQDLTLDAAGNMYITGYAYTANFFPNSIRSFTGSSGRSDAFVIKLDPTGHTILFATYIGSTGYENYYFGGGHIAVDASDNIYISGATGCLSGQDCSDYPTTPTAFQTTHNRSNFNGFVTKFNPDGTQILYSTMLGGNPDGVCCFVFNGINGLAIDNAGHVYVTGETNSLHFPTVNGFQNNAGVTTSNDAGRYVSAFVSKLDTTQSGTASLVYSSYYGGGHIDTAVQGQALLVPAPDDVYITGATSANDMPLVNPYLSTLSGRTNPFVARFNTTLSGAASLRYSTYLGGSLDSEGKQTGGGGNSLGIDANGTIYIGGQTSAVDFPTTPNAFQQTYQGSVAGGADAFAVKMNITDSGSTLLYSTYFGGNGNGGGNIIVNSAGEIYLFGSTRATNLPMVNPIQATYMGAPDGFIAKLNAAGSALIYSTYFGGNGYNSLDIAAVRNGKVYIVGGTTSTNFQTTSDAYQTTPGPSYLAILSENQPPVINPIANATINQGDTYTAAGSFTDLDSTSWTATVDYGDGLGVQPLTLTEMNFSLSHLYNTAGTFTITVNITDNQGATGTGSANITVNPVPTSKDQCKNGGWMNYPNLNFKNQGECVSYVEHHGKNN